MLCVDGKAAAVFEIGVDVECLDQGDSPCVGIRWRIIKGEDGENNA